MPIKSSPQWRLMQLLAHGGKARAKGIGGLSKAKAKEFIAKTHKKKRRMFERSQH